MKGPVTPNLYRKMRRDLKASRADYMNARTAWDGARARHGSTRAQMIRAATQVPYRVELEMEDLIVAAAEAKRWMSIDMMRIANAESRGVVAGSAYSPAAQERLRRSGRLGRAQP